MNPRCLDRYKNWASWLGSFMTLAKPIPVMLKGAQQRQLGSILIARFMRHLHQLFLVVDAIGLVGFTVIGGNEWLVSGTKF